MSDVETDSVEQAVADLFLASTVGRSHPSDSYDCGGVPEFSCYFQNRHSLHPDLACLHEHPVSLQVHGDRELQGLPRSSSESAKSPAPGLWY